MTLAQALEREDRRKEAARMSAKRREALRARNRKDALAVCAIMASGIAILFGLMLVFGA